MGEEKGRILIIEESPLLGSMLQGLLSAAGYEVTVLTDAQHAIDKAGELRPELIFLNVELPRVDSMMAAKVIRAILDDASLQIIFITRKRDLSELAEVYQVGGDEILTLPFDHDELVARVGRRFAYRNGQAREHDRVRVETVSQLMITIAHHINNALGVVNGYAYALKIEDSEAVAAFLDVLRKQNTRIQAVVESLIEMAHNQSLMTTEYLKGGKGMFDVDKQVERLSEVQKQKRAEQENQLAALRQRVKKNAGEEP